MTEITTCELNDRGFANQPGNLGVDYVRWGRGPCAPIPEPIGPREGAVRVGPDAFRILTEEEFALLRESVEAWEAADWRSHAAAFESSWT